MRLVAGSDVQVGSAACDDHVAREFEKLVLGVLCRESRSAKLVIRNAVSIGVLPLCRMLFLRAREVLVNVVAAADRDAFGTTI